MTFLPHSKQFRRITAVATDAKKKTLGVCVEVDLSWAEKTAVPQISPFQVVIYSLASPGLPKKSRTLTFPLDLDNSQHSQSSVMEGQPLVTAAFSDNGLFVGVTESPQSRVIGWQWQKNKIVFSHSMLRIPDESPSSIGVTGNTPIGASPSMRRMTGGAGAGLDGGLPRRRQTNNFEQVAPVESSLQVDRVRFHPDDPNILSTSGPSHIRLWRVTTPSTPEEIKLRGKRAYLELLPSFKRMPLKDQDETYNDHTWTVTVLTVHFFFYPLVPLVRQEKQKLN
jgi:WD40 repeat protein